MLFLAALIVLALVQTLLRGVVFLATKTQFISFFREKKFSEIII